MKTTNSNIPKRAINCTAVLNISLKEVEKLKPDVAEEDTYTIEKWIHGQIQSINENDQITEEEMCALEREALGFYEACIFNKNAVAGRLAWQSTLPESLRCPKNAAEACKYFARYIRKEV